MRQTFIYHLWKVGSFKKRKKTRQCEWKKGLDKFCVCVCVWLTHKTDSDRADWASLSYGWKGGGGKTNTLRHTQLLSDTQHIHCVCSGWQWPEQCWTNTQKYTHSIALWTQTFWHGLSTTVCLVSNSDSVSWLKRRLQQMKPPTKLLWETNSVLEFPFIL